MRNFSRLSAAFFASSITLTVYAQNKGEDISSSTSSNTVLDGIVVYGAHEAYKGDFTQLETPQAELSIDEEVLHDSGAVDLDQALDLSASVARQNNFGGLWNSFAVRGFVGDENLPSNYLVNGFNAGRGFGGPRDLSGIESVEILKGPRAALFGRGEPGGTVNLVTKRPTFDKAGEFKLSAGSFDTYRSDLDWTSPLSDTVAVRIVGFYEDAKSFRDTVETKKQGLSPSIAWLVTDQSELTYEIEYSEQKIPFDRGVVAVNGKLGEIPESRFLGEPGNGPIETYVLGHQLEFQHEFNDDWSALVGYNYRDTSLKGSATENGFSIDDDCNLSRFRRFRDYEATYQVLRGEVSGAFDTGVIEHRIIVGVDTDKFENDQFALRNREEQSINIYDPVYGDLPGFDSSIHTQIDRVEIQRSTGIYLQDQVSFTPWLDMRIGARYDDYRQKLHNRREGVANPTSRQTEHQFSPQLGLVFKVSNSVSLYTAYGENFRLLSGADPEGNGFRPNQSTSVEAGINFELNDGRLVGTFAVFQVEQENILGVNNGTDFAPVAIGEAESRGVEFDLNGEIVDGLNLWLSYAYTEAETKNEFVDGNFGRTVPAGSPLLNIPENQLSIQLVKETQLLGKPFDFGGGVLYVDKRNGYFAQDFELPSYTTVRIFAEYDVSDDIAVRLDVNNLFDEEYYESSFADTWVQPGDPLTAKLSAAFKF